MKTQLLWGLAVLLLVLTASAQAYSNDTQEAEHLQKKYQGWPRFSDSEGFTPLDLDYYIGFLGWSAVFLGAALTFTVVAIIVLCCGVCFCSCVRVPSSTYKIVVVVLILLFLVVTGFVGYDAYVGFSGEDDFHEGILSSSNQTFTFVTTESDNVANLLEDIANYKGVFADKIEIPEELTTFSEDLRNITSDLSKFEDLVVVPVENVRHGMSLATFIVLCIICAANVVGILLRNRIVYIIGGMLAAIMIGVMMTSAAINIAPILFLSDACPNIDSEIKEHTPSFIQEQVQYMLFCNGTYEQVWWPLPQSINDTLKAINQSIEATNNQTLKEELRADYAYVFAIQLDAYRILSCNFTSTTFESLTETVCVPLFLGLHKLYKAELYACLFVTILLFLFIAAALRRHKEEYQEIPEYDVPLLSQSNFESTFTSPPPIASFDFSTDSQKHV